MICNDFTLIARGDDFIKHTLGILCFVLEPD